jgi:hypothetical protein
MDRETIVKIIRELSNKTTDRGCTEAEALSAAAKVDNLLKAYNLTLDKIFVEQTSCVSDTVKTGRRNGHPIRFCCVAIADFCDCKIWQDRYGKDGLSYYFFGMPTDVMMAKHLYQLIYQAIENETVKFKTEQYRAFNSCSKTVSTSFQKGMVIRLARRLEEMLKLRKNQYVSGCTSLVVLKNQKRDKEFALLNLGIKHRQATTTTKINNNAYQAGYQAGNNVPLNKPIHSANSNQLFLTGK